MKVQPDKQLILDSLAAMARSAGRAPSRRRFLAETGTSQYAVLQYFTSWNAAVKAAGLEPDSRRVRRGDGELLADWGEVVRRNGKIPTCYAYHQLGKVRARTMENRFGSWLQVPEAFRKFAKGKREWADVVALLPARKRKPVRGIRFHGKGQPHGRSAATSRRCKFRYRRLRGRPTYGQPMDFRGLRHEPVNEQGVVLLFGMVAKELGYVVEALQCGFPDCEAKRRIAPQRWQRVHLEFEFESRNFRDHGHSVTGCDVIVCWRHNWPNHPPQLEILELSSLIKSLSVQESSE
jgi:hypothetical protein